jgi:hypothetical protein
MVKARRSEGCRAAARCVGPEISLILFEAVEPLRSSRVGRLTLIGESVKPFHFFLSEQLISAGRIEVSRRRQSSSAVGG